MSNFSDFCWKIYFCVRPVRVNHVCEIHSFRNVTVHGECKPCWEPSCRVAFQQMSRSSLMKQSSSWWQPCWRKLLAQRRLRDVSISSVDLTSQRFSSATFTHDTRNKIITRDCDSQFSKKLIFYKISLIYS